jgi:hypothetical protein
MDLLMVLNTLLLSILLWQVPLQCKEVMVIWKWRRTETTTTSEDLRSSAATNAAVELRRDADRRRDADPIRTDVNSVVANE